MNNVVIEVPRTQRCTSRLAPYKDSANSMRSLQVVQSIWSIFVSIGIGCVKFAMLSSTSASLSVSACSYELKCMARSKPMSSVLCCTNANGVCAARSVTFEGKVRRVGLSVWMVCMCVDVVCMLIWCVCMCCCCRIACWRLFLWWSLCRIVGQLAERSKAPV